MVKVTSSYKYFSTIFWACVGNHFDDSMLGKML